MLISTLKCYETSGLGVSFDSCCLLCSYIPRLINCGVYIRVFIIRFLFEYSTFYLEKVSSPKKKKGTNTVRRERRDGGGEKNIGPKITCVIYGPWEDPWLSHFYQHKLRASMGCRTTMVVSLFMCNDIGESSRSSLDLTTFRSELHSRLNTHQRSHYFSSSFFTYSPYSLLFLRPFQGLKNRTSRPIHHLYYLLYQSPFFY